MHTTPGRLRVAAAVVGAAALVGLTACTGPSRPASTTTPGDDELTIMTPAATSEIDEITWNVFAGEPYTIDPYRSANYSPNMINSNLCESLFVQTPDFEIEPNLATGFENPDPLTWVYRLRDDVVFWDGSPMTAEDVAFSLDKNRTDPTSFRHSLYANVESVTATGEHEVTVKLTRPDYLLNDEMASFAGVVVQKKFTEEHGDQVGTPEVGVMCTGPFEYAGWKQAQSITVTRNDDYWNDELKPKAKQIEFTFVIDEAAITAGLLSGEIDGTYGVPTSGLAQLQNTSTGSYYQGPAPMETTLVVANAEGALSELNVRKALQMAIDWKGIGEQVYGGAGTPSALQTPPAAYGYASDELTALADTVKTDGTPRIDEAKQLLEDVPADVLADEISLVVPQQAQTQQLGVAIESAAESIGLNFRLEVVPAVSYGNYLYDPATRGDTDLLYTQFWPGIPDPLDWLSYTAVSGATFNQSNYSGIDELFAEARSTEDEARRIELVVQMEQQLHDDMGPMFPGVELRNDVFMNERITGAPASFDYVWYPWAAWLGGTE